jgi:iron complex outermembrane receptor protein
MSELIVQRSGRRSFQRHLLTTVSALAVLASACRAQIAFASDQDEDRPTVWIELGGQLEHFSGQGQPFQPPFVAANPTSPVFTPISPVQAQRPPGFDNGAQGKISFEPEDSDWVFSAAIRYGRSNGNKHVDHQTEAHRSKYVPPIGSRAGYHVPITHPEEKFSDTTAKQKESHFVADFQAGKDVGLGLFGKGGSSVVSVGVRFAQFDSKSNLNIKARPDLQVYNAGFVPSAYAPAYRFHIHSVAAYATRSVHALGPSISWDASAPFAGSANAAEFSFDWGVNAAILFGRQKAHTHHQTTGQYFKQLQGGYLSSSTYTHPGGRSIARSVTVPNVGGFAGFSLKFPNAKVSLGYRADFFFGAIDGGIDAARKETVGFYGPFATIGVGMGG